MIFKNKKKKLSFEERMELALTKTKFTKKQKDIVRTWYEIEDNEPDISTERLIAMTADISDVEYEYVVDTICEFSTYMD